MQAPPIYEVKLQLPNERDDYLVLISQKLATAHLLMQISSILHVAKDRIDLRFGMRDVTHEPLEELSRKLCHIVWLTLKVGRHCVSRSRVSCSHPRNGPHTY